MAARKTKPKAQETMVSPWTVISAFPAREGTTACWFVDPDEPKMKRVDCWAFAERISRSPVVDGSGMILVDHERAVLPAIILGGKLELCDDADAIVSPEMDVELVANIADEHPLLV